MKKKWIALLIGLIGIGGGFVYLWLSHQSEPVVVLEKNIDRMVEKYQNTYVGDNSSVGGIIDCLPLQRDTFSLQTSETPYEITINYNDKLPLSLTTPEQLKKVIQYNATAMFALIQNVDCIVFDLKTNGTFVTTREEIQSLYEETLSEYMVNRDKWINRILKADKELMALIQTLY